MFLGRVVRVCDGDTIAVLCVDRAPATAAVEYIRFAGIDAAELRGRDRQRATWARNALSALVLDRVCEIWPARIWRDPYHRIIARVICAGMDVGLVMVQQGWVRRKKSGVKKP
jgi:endonuclease YncB( thermonuclease family)